ncbi:uncharacterized protein LOC102457847 [Pelodiscus sinensis]|uniref:uncharacterized protein LOC102457847 n=1 Tax=Pelodiscus sinensis TaxID=13735 RepID=UPI003F6BB629
MVTFEEAADCGAELHQLNVNLSRWDMERIRAEVQWERRAEPAGHPASRLTSAPERKTPAQLKGPREDDIASHKAAAGDLHPGHPGHQTAPGNPGPLLLKYCTFYSTAISGSTDFGQWQQWGGVESTELVLQASPSPTEQGAPNSTSHRTTAGPPRCQPGWALFQGSCYLFSSTNGTWQVARNNCLAQGADLVVISERTEQGYLVRRGGSVRYWIGLTDKEREGDWRWVDDTPLTLAYWNEDEPNNLLSPTPEGEDCAQLLETSLWNDEPCSFSYRWICERAARV